MHWSDLVADELLKRGGAQVIETGTSISGIPHVGNASDVIRGDAVRKVLGERGADVSLIWVADDSDPFRKTPKGMEHLKEHLGKPVYDVPDPKEMHHKNFVEHFSRPFIDDLADFDVKPDVYSGTELYRSRKLVDEIMIALEKRVEIIEILNKFRKLPLPDYWIPWSPICSKCGRISTTHAKKWDGDKIVSYTCTGVDPATQSKDLKDVVGCGHKGESDITEGKGKLSWRVEWAARWHHFKVTCEPFGKEHATVGGSYDTSSVISRQVYGWEPPYPVVYEFFTLNGQKISSSMGNVVTLTDWLGIAEPEVLKFFMYKRLEKQRDIDLSRVPNLTDEYDEAERAFFGGEVDEKVQRHYVLSQVSGEPKACGVPYTLCAVLSQVVPDSDREDSLELIQGKAEAMGYSPDPQRMHTRIVKAGAWVKTPYCPDYLRFDLREGSTEGLSDGQREFLRRVYAEVGKKWSPESFHKRIYEISREMNLKPPEAFKAVYRALIGKERGPKAAAFILSLEADFLKGRFAL